MMIFSQNMPAQLTANITSITKTDTNTKIQYTTSAAHGFSVGDYVTIAGQVGNFAFSTPQLITNITTTSPYTFKIASTNTGTSGTAIATNKTRWNLGDNYLYLTDDNRESVQVTPERIEYKQRMINGRMRSYHVTDKNSFSTSWGNIPSRGQDDSRKYISEYERGGSTITTKYAAGQDIKAWYETYTGDFWMILVYDGGDGTTLDNASSQLEVYNVFFNDFSYDIVKRGQHNDLWDVSIALVEV